MWYAAHIIEVLKLREGKQESFPIVENVVLIEADTPEDAWQKAQKIGMVEYHQTDETITLNGKPAIQTFAGVRKIVECQAPSTEFSLDDSIKTGWEITYSEFEVNSQQAIDELVKGESVRMTYLGK